MYCVSESADREAIECCEEGEVIHAEEKTELQKFLCNPIRVPKSDSLVPVLGRCINFVRSVAVDNLECSGGPIEQLNQITHWLDSSNVYGSSPFRATTVRLFENGKLDAIFGEDGQEQLPVDPVATCVGNVTGTCGFAGKSLF